MNIAFYRNGCLICIIKEVKDIIRNKNGSLEIYVDGKDDPIYKKESEYGGFEIWR